MQMLTKAKAKGLTAFQTRYRRSLYNWTPSHTCTEIHHHTRCSILTLTSIWSLCLGASQSCEDNKKACRAPHNKVTQSLAFPDCNAFEGYTKRTGQVSVSWKRLGIRGLRNGGMRRRIGRSMDGWQLLRNCLRSRNGVRIEFVLSILLWLEAPESGSREAKYWNVHSCGSIGGERLNRLIFEGLEDEMILYRNCHFQHLSSAPLDDPFFKWFSSKF